jgi:predicted alpha/beta-fold hydrolase
MPVLVSSSYIPPLHFLNRHINTIAHALLRNPTVEYNRERLSTKDNDFVDLDFSKTGSKVSFLTSKTMRGRRHSRQLKRFTNVNWLVIK